MITFGVLLWDPLQGQNTYVRIIAWERNAHLAHRRPVCLDPSTVRLLYCFRQYAYFGQQQLGTCYGPLAIEEWSDCVQR